MFWLELQPRKATPGFGSAMTRVEVPTRAPRVVRPAVLKEPFYAWVALPLWVKQGVAVSRTDADPPSRATTAARHGPGLGVAEAVYSNLPCDVVGGRAA